MSRVTMNRTFRGLIDDSRFRWFLAVILLVSVTLRLVAAMYLGNQVVDLPGTADQISYHNLAQRVLDGHGFSFGEPWWPATAANAPTAHWSYLYTGFLVLVYSLFGPNPLAARVLQALVVGLLQPYLAYRLGDKLYGPLVGLLAAAFTGIYAYFVYYAANLMTEAFYITAILASLYFAIRLAEAPQAGLNLRWALPLGLSLAVVVLLRQVFLLFIPFLFLWILFSGFKRHLASIIVVGTLIVLTIAPFTVYNYIRFQRLVLLNTNAGFAFFWGNHPIYGTHFQSILPSGEYYDLIPEDLRSLDEAALDQALLGRALENVFDDPLRYVQLSISRIPVYFMFWPSSDSGTTSNLARVLSFGLFWPFMLYGLLRSMFLHPSPWRLRPASPVLLLYGFVLIYTAIHVLTWTLIRYRLPVDAVLLVFAALGVVDLAVRIPALRRVLSRQTAWLPQQLTG